MKYRPPLRTAEIHAYNFGRRAAAAGIDLPAVVTLDGSPPALVLTPAELEAVSQLGPDQFGRWSLKGWIAE